MSDIKFMSESEKEIMDIIWENPHPITSKQIMDKLITLKPWKITTVQTFLSRLENKGIIVSAKEGKQKLYTPAITAKEYGEKETEYFIQTVHKGSLKSFMTALSGADGISSSDMEELREWLLGQSEVDDESR